MFFWNTLAFSVIQWMLILNMILPLLPSFWGFSFALGCGVYYFDGIQHSPFIGCSGASCNFGVFAGEDGHTSFYSAILAQEKEMQNGKMLSEPLQIAEKRKEVKTKEKRKGISI